jgi:hypothetical protein
MLARELSHLNPLNTCTYLSKHSFEYYRPICHQISQMGCLLYGLSVKHIPHIANLAFLDATHLQECQLRNSVFCTSTQPVRASSNTPDLY